MLHLSSSQTLVIDMFRITCVFCSARGWILVLVDRNVQTVLFPAKPPLTVCISCWPSSSRPVVGTLKAWVGNSVRLPCRLSGHRRLAQSALFTTNTATGNVFLKVCQCFKNFHALREKSQFWLLKYKHSFQPRPALIYVVHLYRQHADWSSPVSQPEV